MPTAIGLPDDVIAAIDEVAAELGISRADFVQRAIAAALLPYRQSRDAEVFGILAGKLEDGLRYQKRLRSEWD